MFCLYSSDVKEENKTLCFLFILFIRECGSLTANCIVCALFSVISGIFIHGLHGFARIFLSANYQFLKCSNPQFLNTLTANYANCTNAQSEAGHRLLLYFFPRITRICTDFFIRKSSIPQILSFSIL
jgi:hypothetical protein